MVVSASAIGLGCRTPTQITVEVTTDVPCDQPGTQANTVISVGSLDSKLADRNVAVTSTCHKVDATTWRIGSLVVLPSGDKGAEVAIEVLTGINVDPGNCSKPEHKKDCIVARRAMHFVEHSELYLPIGLDVACEGILCDTTTTCVAGRCVLAIIDDSALCTTPTACDESVLSKNPFGDGGLDAAGDVFADVSDSGPDSSTDSALEGGVDAAETGDASDTTPPSGWKKIANASDGRNDHFAVWTGTEMIVFGGALKSIAGYTNSGARYDPKADAWKATSTPSIVGRRYCAMHWTGSEALVWGGEGFLNDGARYDPKTDGWKTMGGTPPVGRDDFTSVYAPERREFIVFGGTDSSSVDHSDGARYSLDTDSWTPITDAKTIGFKGRSEATAAWDGKRMIVYGGLCGAYCTDVAAYDPADLTAGPGGTWKSLGALPIANRADGFSLVVGTPAAPLVTFFGGGSFSAPLGFTDGATWSGTGWLPFAQPASTIVADPGRTRPSAWAGGDRVFFWGGFGGTANHADGAMYDRPTGKWTALTGGSPLGPRMRATAVWTGTSAIIFGGNGGIPGGTEDELPDGAMFTP